MPHLTVTLADTILKFGVKAAHGESIDTPRGKLIPVALVSYGLGAGGDGKENGGGGGGGFTLPLGAYEITSAGTRFIPNTVTLLWALTPLLGATLGVLRRRR